jgi:nicotinamidase-related amidase
VTLDADDGVSDQTVEAWRRAQLTVEYEGSIVAFAEVARHFNTPVFLITGWNPGGDALPRQDNERANEDLVRVLDDAGFEFWPAVGADASSEWSEPGFMVNGADRSSMRALGRRFGQVAIYEADAAGVRIVWCERDLVIEKDL